MIVETEAYYGIDDPASRAYKGRVTKISRIMYEGPGTVLVYMVHANWLFNVITEPPGVPSGVLVRALEPTIGIELMKKNRGVKDIHKLCNGPGKLTKALSIDKSLNGYKVYDPHSPVMIFNYREYSESEIISSKRVGVTRDLEIPLRFYVRNSKFVSK
jgi:DNA-3-methyladenine glycosylase